MIVTELHHRDTHECVYATLERRRKRVKVSYTVMKPGRPFEDVLKTYPDLVAFSKDWRITARMELE